jgi:hypothetical protein
MVLNPTKATYDNLLLAYRMLNQILFNSMLPACLITLQRDATSYGYFCKNRFINKDDSKEYTDEIALNPQYFKLPGRDDKKVISTLAHEMCHLWQSHFGKPGRGRYHNKEWANKMRSLGLIPSNTGLEGGMDTGDQMSHYIEKNGVYENAFTELLVAGFSLDWTDNQPQIEELIVPVDKKCIDEGDATETIDSVDFVDSPFTIAPIKTVIQSQKGKSGKIDTSKIKYSCPECGLNVWAKLGANIKCGDCDEYLNSMIS